MSGKQTKLRALVAIVLVPLFLLTARESGASTATPSIQSPPVSTRAPRIEGKPQVGQVLQADRGKWRGDRTAVFTFQWRLCDAAGKTCVDIPNASDRIYPVRAEDLGHRLLIAVTASTSAGKATAQSVPTSTVVAPLPDAPLVAARPTIAGDPEVGAVLAAQKGSWQGTEPMRFHYRWRRCGPGGGACVDLGRTAQSYQLTTRDQDHTLRVLVSAANTVGTSVALSDPTKVVVGPTSAPMTVPTNSSPPVISGIAAQGKTLTVSSGTWSGTPPLRFSFEWRRCKRDGEHCSTVTRGSRQTYTLVQADVGSTIRVRVTASNAAGSGSALSDHTPVVVGASAPVNTSPPVISGTAREGSVLTVSPGAWRGTAPISFRYQWLRCDTGGGRCGSISGATVSSRTLTSADVGRTLRVSVTATNSGGSASVLSGPSALVASKGVAPANTRAPLLSGTALQGERLSVSSGSWTGTQPITLSYRWMRCNSALNDCRAIGGATGSTFVLTRADVGNRVYGVVTARNSAGSASASSNATPVIVGAPVNTSPPTIAGRAVEGETLTVVPGAWAGVTPISFGYQWTRCAASGVFSTCAPILVTSRPTYMLRLADVGHRIFVQVKAQNRYGASYVNSTLTELVAPAPVGTVTIRPVQSIVRYGRPVSLTGRAVGAPAGEPVSIIEQPLRGNGLVREHVAVINNAGVWTYVAHPTIGTTYHARVRDKTSGGITVLVRPRVHVKRLAPGKLSVRVVASRSFVRRVVILQRWNPRQHRWVNTKRLRLRTARAGVPPTVVSVATAGTRLPRGTRVRVVLTSRQAGVGYLGGTSNTVRT